MILVGIKVIPPCFSNYQFEDAIKKDALQATYTSRSEEDIRKAVIKHAHEYDIPLTPQQVQVSRTGGFRHWHLTLRPNTACRLNCPAIRPRSNSILPVQTRVSTDRGRFLRKRQGFRPCTSAIPSGLRFWRIVGFRTSMGHVLKPTSPTSTRSIAACTLSQPLQTHPSPI